MMRILELSTAIVMLGCLVLTVCGSAAGATFIDDRDDDVIGQVTAVDTTNKRFTLRIGGGSGQSLTITTNAKTEFDDFDDAGLANAFSSVAVGQLLEVDLAHGTLVAREVELKRAPNRIPDR